jgi:hypothetical protein
MNDSKFYFGLPAPHRMKITPVRTTHFPTACGAISDSWTLTPIGNARGVNDAISLYFADVTLASAFVARRCVEAGRGDRGRVPSTRGRAGNAGRRGCIDTMTAVGVKDAADQLLPISRDPYEVQAFPWSGLAPCARASASDM